MIKKIILCRNWWSFIVNSHSNFRWMPFSNGFKFEKLISNDFSENKTSINHFEGHREISVKSNLLINLMNYFDVKIFFFKFNKNKYKRKKICQFLISVLLAIFLI